MYHLEVRHATFAPASQSVEIRSAIPTSQLVKLGMSPLQTTIEVQANDTLVDPHRVGSVNQVGADTITDRETSLPGRSLQDLVNSQPGWLYEGNAVLHPRGSEYQTQFVVDGIPLTDNRSPGHGPEMEADSVQSMSVYTAGIPAEYGRKMGGVIEVNTAKNNREGLHGQFVLSGGSFDTAGVYTDAPVSVREKPLRDQCQRSDDQPLSQSSGYPELHQQWNHRGFRRHLRAGLHARATA